MTDIFREVDEEVRREQLLRLWQRHGYLIIVIAVLVVAGVGGWRGYESWQAKKAAESGTAFQQAMTFAETGKHPEAEAAFARIAVNGTAGYRVLARLRQAAELVRTDRKAAIKAYDDIAADKSLGQVFQDLAAIRAGILLVDTSAYSEMRQRLEPLTASGRSFRHDARELLALSAWKAGDMSAAQQWTAMIVADPETPSGARGRAQILGELIAANGKG